MKIVNGEGVNASDGLWGVEHITCTCCSAKVRFGFYTVVGGMRFKGPTSVFDPGPSPIHCMETKICIVIPKQLFNCSCLIFFGVGVWVFVP